METPKIYGISDGKSWLEFPYGQILHSPYIEVIRAHMLAAKRERPQATGYAIYSFGPDGMPVPVEGESA